MCQCASFSAPVRLGPAWRPCWPSPPSSPPGPSPPGCPTGRTTCLPPTSPACPMTSLMILFILAFNLCTSQPEPGPLPGGQAAGLLLALQGALWRTTGACLAAPDRGVPHPHRLRLGQSGAVDHPHRPAGAPPVVLSPCCVWRRWPWAVPAGWSSPGPGSWAGSSSSSPSAGHRRGPASGRHLGHLGGGQPGRPAHGSSPPGRWGSWGPARVFCGAPSRADTVK